MNPIREEADLLFGEAAICRRLRPARRDGLTGHDEALAGRLRAGLIGCAALHLLLLSSVVGEEREVLSFAAEYCREAEAEGNFPPGSVAAMRGLYLRLYRSLCPLELGLRVVANEFGELHFRTKLALLWPQPRRVARFDRAADNSVRYALNFFERQQLGFAEVPAIALLDE